MSDNNKYDGYNEDNKKSGNDLNYIFDGEEGGKEDKRQNLEPQREKQEISGGIYAKNEMRLAPQSKVSKNFVKIFISVFLSIAIFVAGFLTAYELVPSEEEKLARWIKNTVDQRFLDVDGGGVDFISGIGNGMVSSLDQFSSFYYAESMAEKDRQNKGEYNEIGMEIGIPEGEEFVRVIKVYGESPAYKKGIKRGDIIKKALKGETQYDLENKSASEVLAKIREILSEQGEVGIEFERRYEGESESKAAETITVQGLKPQVYSRTYSYYYDNTSEEMSGAGLDDDTAYITLDGFLLGADTQFEQNMIKFREDGKKNLILDLRTNTGGSLDILQNIASHLITDGLNNKSMVLMNVQYKGIDDKISVNTANNYYNSYNFESIMVLTDGYSASATEVLLAAMKDYGTVAKQIGTKTYGKAVMQSYFEYNKKYGMYITVGKIFYPKNADITYNKVGLIPDYVKEFNYAGEYKYDNAIVKAVELISSSGSI